ncbi:MAG: DNA helicase, partial [Pseudomonadota bacterium]
MNTGDHITQFYLQYLQGAQADGFLLKAPCPFCPHAENGSPGELVVDLDPDSFFYGYFKCLSRCKPGGFAPHFGRLLGLDPKLVPGFDPDRSVYVRDILFPAKNLNAEIKKYQSMMSETQYGFFSDCGVSKAAVDELRIGYNGRYLVYPYFLEDGNCYAARCILFGKEEDN